MTTIPTKSSLPATASPAKIAILLILGDSLWIRTQLLKTEYVSKVEMLKLTFAATCAGTVVMTTYQIGTE